MITNCKDCEYVKDGICMVDKDSKCPIKINLPLTKKELVHVDILLNCWEAKGIILKLKHVKEKLIKETGNP